MSKSDVVTEHFKCACGHEWSRELEDGLVAVGCPACKQKKHLTALGRLFERVIPREHLTRVGSGVGWRGSCRVSWRVENGGSGWLVRSGLRPGFVRPENGR